MSMKKVVALTAVVAALTLSAGPSQAVAPTDRVASHVQTRVRTTHYSITPLCLHQRRHKVGGHWSEWHTVRVAAHACR